MASLTLMGDLASFGGPYILDAPTPQALVGALCHQLKGFKKRILEGSYRVIYKRGGRQFDLDENTVDVRLARDAEIVIIPVAHGAGGGGNGTTKILMGVALIALAVVTSGAATAAYGALTGVAGTGTAGLMGSVAFMGVTFSQIAGFGIAMVLTGISQAFMGSASTTSTKAGADANASYVFNGPVNTARQGAAKPLVFGEFICGSVAISSDITAERI